MCVSHTLSHCMEHVDLPVLNDFMTPWLGLVQHHPSAKRMWRETIGAAMKGFSTIRWLSREEVAAELAKNFGALPNYVDKLLEDEIGDAYTKKMRDILCSNREALQLELACNLDMEPIVKTCYSLEGDGLVALLARRKLDALLSWGDKVGDQTDSLPNVAALLRSKCDMTPGTKVYEYFADVTPPRYFRGEIVAPRSPGLITIRYEDNCRIDQEEHEARQWVDVREHPEWRRLVKAAKAGITYLRNRMTGDLPANQINYDCSGMFQVLNVIQAFDPTWAASNLSNESVRALAVVKPLRKLVPDLVKEMDSYRCAAKHVSIDHTESVVDHSFTTGVLKFFKEHRAEFPAWAQAARIVFAFTPNSAAAERVFSLLNSMFDDDQLNSLADYIQTAVMLCYNRRELG